MKIDIYYQVLQCIGDFLSILVHLPAPGGSSLIFARGCAISGFETPPFDKARFKEKKHPSEKRVPFVAIAHQGPCFGTLLSLSAETKTVHWMILLKTIFLAHDSLYKALHTHFSCT